MEVLVGLGVRLTGTYWFVCRMGKSLPDEIYEEKTTSRMGLNLPRGPDPRSFNSLLAITAATGRSMFGMDM